MELYEAIYNLFVVLNNVNTPIAEKGVVVIPLEQRDNYDDLDKAIATANPLLQEEEACTLQRVGKVLLVDMYER